MFYKRYAPNVRIRTAFKNHSKLIFYILFFVIVAGVYKEYLLASRLFLSKYEAMDLYDQYYPTLLSTSRSISSFNLSPHIDFTKGLGEGISLIFPLIQSLPAYFGEKNVAYLLGVFQAAKVYFSGIFFFEYVSTMGKSRFTAAVTAMCYAFCGHMMLRQYWAFYPVEVLLVAMWLWAFEMAYSKHDKRWLPLATFLFFINCSLYYAFLYCLIFAGYCFLRLFLESKFTLKRYFKFLICIGMIALITIGAVSFVEKLGAALSSDRMAVAVENTLKDSEDIEPLTFFTDKKAYISALYRTLGVNIVQGKDNPLWWNDILSDPIFYCGLLIIILLPGCFLHGMKMHKWIYSGVLVLPMAYISVEPFRILVNGFASNYFKLSSFWISVLILYIVASNLDDFFQWSSPFKYIPSFILGCAFIRISFWLSSSYALNMEELKKSIALIGIYMLILLWSAMSNKTGCAKILLLLFVALEVYDQGVVNVTSMDTISAAEFQKKGYNDNTLQALEYLDTMESVKNYRIDKQYFSYGLCDSLAQNYFGTSFYIGGLGGNAYVKEFYDSLKLPTAKDYTGTTYRYAYGSSAYEEVNQVLGIEYVLSKRDHIINYGYELISKIENIRLWKNQYALPLGYVYHSYITKDDYQLLSTFEKGRSLLKSCVLNDQAETPLPKTVSKTSTNDMELDFSEYRKYLISYNYSDNNCLLKGNPMGNVLVLSVSFDLDESEYRGTLCYDNGEASSYRVRLDKETDEHIFEINSPDIVSVYFKDSKGTRLPFRVNACYSIPQEVYYKDYRANSQRLISNGVSIDTFQGNYVKGMVQTDQDGILYFSIPYSSGWDIYIDGIKSNIFIANLGFLGCVITKGEHTVELHYNNPVEFINSVLKIILLCLCICAVFYFSPRRSNKGHRFRRGALGRFAPEA